MNLIAPINIVSLEAIVVCILCTSNIILYTVLLPIFIMIYKLCTIPRCTYCQRYRCNDVYMYGTCTCLFVKRQLRYDFIAAAIKCRSVWLRSVCLSVCLSLSVYLSLSCSLSFSILSIICSTTDVPLNK